MTKNKRAKRDARERKQRTGEPYVVARRESGGKTLREQLFADLIELDLDPAEWTDATDDEIAAGRAAFMADTTPEVMAATLECLLPALDRPTRRAGTDSYNLLRERDRYPAPGARLAVRSAGNPRQGSERCCMTSGPRSWGRGSSARCTSRHCAGWG